MRTEIRIKLKRLLADAAVLALSTLSLCGCYDSTETENRKYVVLMGIDGSQKQQDMPEEINLMGDNGKYILSAGEAELESDIDKSSEKQKTILVCGDTIPEMRKLADMYSSKKMYFGQLKAVVIGSDIYTKKESLTDIIYAMERMEDINTKIVVFASETAYDTVNTVMDKGSKGGLYLWDYYKNNGGETDLNEYMNFEYLIKSMRQDGTFIIPKISTADGEVYLDGGIVISEDEFKGDITTVDVGNAKWIKGTAEGELVTWENISAKVKEQKTEISWDDGILNIRIDASLALESGYDVDKDGVEAEFERVIDESLTDTIERSIYLNADFLQLNPDGDIQGLKFDVETNVQIISAGVIK